MKKFKLLAILLATTALLTGCGEKEESSKKDNKKEEKNIISCSMTEEDDGLEMLENIKIEYKNDKPSVITMSITATVVDDEIKSEWEEFVEMLDMIYQEQDEDGLKITTEDNKKDYSYEIVIEVDLENATEEVLEEFGFDDIEEYNDIKEAKESLELDGYTCK